MRFNDLQPRWSRVYRDFTPETGGIGTDRHQIIFVCPSCGFPRTICIYVGPRHLAEPKTWQANYPEPDGPNWPDKLTITPSIDNTRSGHGPKHPKCGFHGTIMNGEVIYAAI